MLEAVDAHSSLRPLTYTVYIYSIYKYIHILYAVYFIPVYYKYKTVLLFLLLKKNFFFKFHNQ